MTGYAEWNWETEEVITWLSNYEPLYLDTEDITHTQTMKETVIYHLSPVLKDFDWSEVDWDEVVEARQED